MAVLFTWPVRLELVEGLTTNGIDQHYLRALDYSMFVFAIKGGIQKLGKR
jgi:hypothetical protein